MADKMADEQVKGFDELFEEALADGEVDTELEGSNEEGSPDTDRTNNTDDTDATDANTNDNTTSDDDGKDNDNKDYRALYEQELQRTKSWDGRLSAKDRELATLKQELATAKAKEAEQKEADDPTTDEAIEAFLKEFPELAAPIQKMIEKATKTRSKELVTDIEGRIENRLKPIAQTVQEGSVEKHLKAIRSAHSDFDDIVKSGTLQTWINEQPAYMQSALQAVYDAGTTQDVIDLLSQYKTAASVQQSQANLKPANKRPSAAIKSRHSTPMSRQQKIDEDDFDGALAAAFAND
jgi:hypothetical protein